MPVSPANRTVAAVAVVSASALGLALTSQVGFNLWPCDLCYLQRAPYAATFAVGLLALMPAVDTASKRTAVLLCAALFALNAGFGVYHVGVEQHWWQSACTGGNLDLSAADLMAAVQRPGQPMCDEIAFSFLGVSMAGYNVIFCLIFAAGCLFAARREAWWRSP